MKFHGSLQIFRNRAEMTIHRSFLTLLVCLPFIVAEIPERSLLQALTNRHNKLLRPTPTQGGVLPIIVRFYPRGVNDFDEVVGKISVAMAVDFRWKDNTLSWNKDKYGNITSLVLPGSKIWTPSFALANPVGRTSLFPEDEFNARIYFSGDVVWVKAGTVITTCKPYVKYYPFDVHRCSIKLFPMGQILTEIKLVPDLKMDVFDNFGQWNLFNEVVKDGSLNAFSLVSFEFSVERRPEFSLLSLCIPILFLGVLNSCVFLIPPESGERMSYAITVLLSFAVFMTIISANMPKNSDPVPILCYVLMVMMAESSGIVILTIYGLRLYFRSEKEPIPKILHLTARRFETKRMNEALSVDGFTDSTEESQRHVPTPSVSNRMCKSWRDVAEVYDKACFVVSFIVFLGTLIFYVISVDGMTLTNTTETG